MKINVCYMTKTRLMGVLAGYIEYELDGERIVEFYHIEFEEYGIDRFELLKTPNAYQIQQMSLEIFGGLGGELVELSHDEFAQLILSGMIVNRVSEQLVYAETHSKWLSHDLIFNAEHFSTAIEKVVEELRSPYEIINYFIMRYVGCDDIYLRYTVSEYEWLETRFTLMRNHIEQNDDGSYRFSALLLAEQYYIMDGLIELDEGVVMSFNIDTVIQVTDLEAAMMLRQMEFIYVYDVADSMIESHLIGEHKYLAPMLYPNGRLYTSYQKHNNHVNSKTFYLSADVEVYFYFTDSEQLLLCSHDRNAMFKWDDLLTNRFISDIEKYEELEFEESVLYDFIASEFVDFDDYLNELGV